MTLVLPRLAGSRAAVASLLGTLVKDEIPDNTVVVDARDLASGSPSFADELVRELLVGFGAKRIRVVGAPADFQTYVQRSAAKRELADRVEVIEAGTELGAL